MQNSMIYFQISFSFLLCFFIVFLKNKILRFANKKSADQADVWQEVILASLKLPSTIFIIVLFLSYSFSLVEHHFPNAITIILLNKIIKTVGIIIVLAWFLLNIIRNGEKKFFDTPDKDEALDVASSHIAGKLLRAFVVTLAVILILQSLGYSLSGLLTIGGAGSLIMGLAAKDMLSNFFGGLTVLLDKPFKVGDSIKLDNNKLEGVVEKIGWRTTRLKNAEKCPVYVPNNIWSNVPVENISRMSSRRIKETISLRYEDFDKIQPILKELEEILKNHPGVNQKQPIIIKFEQFAPSSLDINVLLYTKSTKLKQYLTTKQEILFIVYDIITKHGAFFAITTGVH